MIVMFVKDVLVFKALKLVKMNKNNPKALFCSPQPIVNLTGHHHRILILIYSLTLVHLSISVLDLNFPICTLLAEGIV
jgi:hypothetical protein